MITFFLSIRQFILWRVKKSCLSKVCNHKDKTNMAKTCFSRCTRITAQVNIYISGIPGRSPQTFSATILGSEQTEVTRFISCFLSNTQTSHTPPILDCVPTRSKDFSWRMCNHEVHILENIVYEENGDCVWWGGAHIFLYLPFFTVISTLWWKKSTAPEYELHSCPHFN